MGRFRTSREAYDWIRWDPAFDPRRKGELVWDRDARIDRLAEIRDASRR